jgi:hypothetical protein
VRGGSNYEPTTNNQQPTTSNQQPLTLSPAWIGVPRRRYEAASSTVAALKTSIGSMFQSSGCDTPVVRQVMGEDATVTEQNMLAHLGIIEQRVTELLKAHAVARMADGGEVNLQALTAQPLTTMSNRIVIEPPSTTHEEEIEGVEPEPMDDDRPLDREVLTMRINKTLHKKLETCIKVRPPGVDAPAPKKIAARR